MTTVHQTSGAQDVDSLPNKEQMPELILYSHSNLFYWWPVWLLGYIFAALTYFNNVQVDIAGQKVLTHPSKNLGVYFTVVFFLVILFTNVSLRGMTSLVVILIMAFFTVLFAWLDWWQEILKVLPHLAIYMNLGFYLFFATAVFVVWALAFFVFDRFDYWRIRPGQITHERFIGGGERSYDTRGMLFEKHLEDFFKHHILGLGSGDLRISTAGARREEFLIPNVLFIDRKVKAIQKLIAIKPDEGPDRVMTAGSPD
jgi:hypothetical protein